MDFSRKEEKKLQNLMSEFEVEIPKSKNAEFIEYLTADLNEICTHFKLDSINLAQTTTQ